MIALWSSHHGHKTPSIINGRQYNHAIEFNVLPDDATHNHVDHHLFPSMYYLHFYLLYAML